MRGLTVGLLALLVASSVGKVEAQTGFVSLTECGNILTVCASVQVSTFWNGTETEVTMRIRNLEGVVPGGDDAVHRIQSVWLTNATSTVFWAPNFFDPLCDEPIPQTGTCSVIVSTEGNVAPVGGGDMGWVVGPAGSLPARAQLFVGPVSGGLFGCSIGEGDGLSTCAPLDQVSWLTLSFTTPSEWSADDVGITWGTDGDPGATIQCTDGIASPEFPFGDDCDPADIDFATEAVADGDMDGIEDAIDTDPSTFSNAFADGGAITTAGTIVFRGDQTLAITDVVDAGVRIASGTSGGATVAFVQVDCVPPIGYALTPGDVFIATCGSAETQVVQGPVEAQVGAFELTIPDGGIVTVTEDVDGQLTVENQSPPEVDPILVAVQGQVVSQLGAGESLLEGGLEVKFARVRRHRKAGRDRFGALGRMVLGAGNDGVDLGTEDLTVMFNGFSQTIPAGKAPRIVTTRKLTWLELPDGHGRLLFWSSGKFGIEIRNLDLSGLDLAEPVPFSLRIGDDLATTAIPFNRHGLFFAHSSGSAAALADASGLPAEPDLYLRQAAESATVAPGRAATYDLLLSPLGVFFDKEVMLSCAGLPAGAHCSFAPSTITPGAAGAASTLTVTTMGWSVAAAPPASRRERLPLDVLWLSAAALVLGSLVLANRQPTCRRLRAYAPLALVLLLVTLYTACREDVTAPPSGGVTPLGTHSFTITAAADGVERSIAATLTVGF